MMQGRKPRGTGTPRSWKGKETDSLLEPPAGTGPADALILTLRPM